MMRSMMRGLIRGLIAASTSLLKRCTLSRACPGAAVFGRTAETGRSRAPKCRHKPCRRVCAARGVAGRGARAPGRPRVPTTGHTPSSSVAQHIRPIPTQPTDPLGDCGPPSHALHGAKIPTIRSSSLPCGRLVATSVATDTTWWPSSSTRHTQPCAHRYIQYGTCINAHMPTHAETQTARHRQGPS